MAGKPTGRPTGRPSKGPWRVFGARIKADVAEAFLEKAQQMGLNKTDAMEAAMAAFAGMPPRDRQEVIPLA